MTRRTRFIAGVFAFLALTFSFSESVWASTCAPGMEMGASAEVASDGAPEASHCLPERQAEREHGEHGDESRDCPFGSPAAVQTCTGVASLPAQVSVFFSPSFEGAASVFTLETESDLLLESALFRPPRA